jgi:hypothetical protein
MPVDPLTVQDQTTLAMADATAIRGVLASLGARAVPPWLRQGHPFPDGALPMGQAAFAAVPSVDLVEIISVRGPLHVIDGWSYVGRALNALISGNAHASRHLAYYAELRAALSILASSGVGIFNRRNVVIDALGAVHPLQDRSTHDMCWATILHWAQLGGSLDRIAEPISIAGVSLLEPLRDFFPGSSSAAVASYLMQEWGFDLEQGAQDRDERNRSSYHPTALSPINTSPGDDLAFLTMFWEALRPGGITLERHLLRILLEAEERSLNNGTIAERGDRYARVDDRVQAAVSLRFLTRIDDPIDHQFLIYASQRGLPAHPYAMLCRAALLLRLATGMAEANLVAAGVQPAVHFDDWWRQFGIQHGLWSPPYAPANSQELWEDVSVALEDAAIAPTDHRHRWNAALAGSAFRICEAERVALWGLFR